MVVALQPSSCGTWPKAPSPALKRAALISLSPPREKIKPGGRLASTRSPHHLLSCIALSHVDEEVAQPVSLRRARRDLEALTFLVHDVHINALPLRSIRTCNMAEARLATRPRGHHHRRQAVLGHNVAAPVTTSRPRSSRLSRSPWSNSWSMTREIPAAASTAICSSTCSTRPTIQPRPRRCSMPDPGLPDPPRKSMILFSRRLKAAASAQTTIPVISDNGSVDGSRPAFAHSSSNRSRASRHRAGLQKNTLYSSAHRTANRLERAPASPPRIKGG